MGLSGRPRVGGPLFEYALRGSSVVDAVVTALVLPGQASRSDAARIASAMTGFSSASAPCG